MIPARNLLREQGHMVCLIKPQFEAGRDKVGKKGVVRDPAVHKEVIGKVIDYAGLVGFGILGLTYSPIKGPEGNIEYLIYLEKEREIPEAVEAMTEAEAEGALRELTKRQDGMAHSAETPALRVGLKNSSSTPSAMNSIPVLPSWVYSFMNGSSRAQRMFSAIHTRACSSNC